MENKILSEYERLNSQGKKFVNAAIMSAASIPGNLQVMSEDEMQEIKRQQEEEQRARRAAEEKHHRNFEELKLECDNMTSEEYIAKLNEVFAKLPTYKLRYFFIFINAKLGYDIEYNVTNK